MPLDANVRALTEGPNYAAFTTLFEDGTPQTQMMWVDSDDEHVLINSEIHRVKVANVRRDPRVSVLIARADRPFEYAEVRGRVVETIGGQAARDHIDVVARRYLDVESYPYPIKSERVILRIVPDRVYLHGL